MTNNTCDTLKHTLVLSSSQNENFDAYIFTYIFDNTQEHNLKNLYYEPIENTSIFMSNIKSQEKFCWCCDLPEGALVVVNLGCEGSTSDSGNQSNDNDTNNNSNDDTNNENNYNDTGNGEPSNSNRHGGNEDTPPGNSSEYNDNSGGNETIATTIPNSDSSTIDNLFPYLNNPNNISNWLYNPNNYNNVTQLYNYLSNQNFSQPAIDFVNSAITALINGDVNNFDELLNQEMSNNDQLEFDPIFWDNFSFQHQNLPSYTNFNNAYPKNMSGTDVFQLVGGNINSMAIANGWVNACATRVSRALNYSGVSIPNIPGKTFKGGDNKYYFVSAANLYRWMIGTFGQPTISLSGTQAHTDGSGFFTQANGQKGIYILIPNYPALFGASGHADIFDGQDFDGHGYFNASGGVHSVNLWVLP